MELGHSIGLSINRQKTTIQNKTTAFKAEQCEKFLTRIFSHRENNAGVSLCIKRAGHTIYPRYRISYNKNII